MIDEIDLLRIYLRQYALCFKQVATVSLSPKACYFTANFYQQRRLIAGFDISREQIDLWALRPKLDAWGMICHLQVDLSDPDGPSKIFEKIDQIYSDAYFSSKKNTPRTRSIGHRH